MRASHLLLSLFIAAGITACGGSDSGKKTSSNSSSSSVVSSVASSASSVEESSSSSSSGPVLTGVFLDSAVIRIGYRTESLEGVTNEQGEFTYREGETVVFFIGDLELPPVAAEAIITPLEIANTQDANSPLVVNITRLLQSLDSDGDASNGITLDEATIAAAQVLDFNLSKEEFAQQAGIQSWLQAAGVPHQTLVSEEDAKAHFETTIEFVYGPSSSSSSLVASESSAPASSSSPASETSSAQSSVTESSVSSSSSEIVVVSSSSSEASSSEAAVSSEASSSSEVAVSSEASSSSEVSVSSEASSSSEVAVSSESSSSEASSSSEESSVASSSSSEESSSESSSSSSEVVPEACANATGLYFCDDFSAGSDNWDLLPTTINTLVPNGQFMVDVDGGNHILKYTAASTGGVLALVKPSAFTGVSTADYYVEAKIRPRANSTTSNKQLYILARYQDGNNWYGGALNVQNASTSTQVEIAKMAAGSLSRPKQVKKPILQGTAGMLDGQWYTLRLELLGNQLTVYLDGENLGSITDSSFTTSGLIGLWTANKSFEIDDVKVGNANDKPASLLISPSATTYNAEVGDAAKVISVTAKADSGAADAFTAVSSDEGVVAVSVVDNDVTLTPVGEGAATITITSASGLVRTVSATIAPQFVMPTATYSFTDQLVPAAGENNAYEDLTLKLTFDSVPTLGTAGSIRIFKTSDNTMVDKIALVDESDSIGYGTLRTIKTRPVRISGNTASISLHANKLEAGTSYYVAISDSVFTGATLAGQTFAGIGDASGWSFTTRAAGPDSGVTSLVVDDDGATADFRSVQGALNFVMKNATANATITVKDGIYEEPLYLRNTNNLTIQGESREGTVIQYPNNELLNSGSTGRAVFLVEGGDMLTLDNLTLKNTTLIGAGGQAETIYFNSNDGRLVATNANFISEQDTLLLKGWNWFYNTLVAGNVDFIWGYSKAALFEQSEIRSLGRSSSNNNGGYVLQARVEAAGDKGFVFLNSTLTGGEGPTGETPIDGTFYLARSPGGTTTYDNIVFVNTKMGTHINAIGWAGGGINSQPVANPSVGNATTGWREYNTMDLDGYALNMASRQFGYNMSLGEVQTSYCSREQIFAAYGSGAGWDPLPSDTSDCMSVVASSSSSAESSAASSDSSSSDASSSASSEASSSAASSDASSDSSSSESSSDMGGSSSESSSSAAASININWVPTYTDLQSLVAGDPAATANSNFAPTASPVSVGGINIYSSTDGSLRLNNSGTAYSINYNGTAVKSDSTGTPVVLVEGTSGQVDPTSLNAAGGVSRYVSVPFEGAVDAVTVAVTFTNSSSSCVNGQVALVDQNGKTWKAVSACVSSTETVISATIEDANVTELYVLMTRSGDSGGGIRVWNIQVTRN